MTEPIFQGSDQTHGRVRIRPLFAKVSAWLRNDNDKAPYAGHVPPRPLPPPAPSAPETEIPVSPVPRDRIESRIADALEMFYGSREKYTLIASDIYEAVIGLLPDADPEMAADVCISRSEMHSKNNDHSAANEAKKCASAIRAARIPPATTHKLNADQTVAVATDVYFNPDMSTAPRGVKLQLIGEGGVAVYSIYNGDPFWIEWAPVPKRRKAA